jgi:hypothetical protein
MTRRTAARLGPALKPGYTKEDLERLRRAHRGEDSVTVEEVEGPDRDAALVRLGEQWRREEAKVSPATLHDAVAAACTSVA